MVWLWLFNPIVGFFNAVLTGLGLPAQNWLNDPNLAIWSVIMVAFWKNVGMNMLLFLSALVSVPVELTEAATLEGAGRWQRFLADRFTAHLADLVFRDRHHGAARPG